MLKKLAIGAALCALSTAATAADLPSRTAVVAPVATATNWGGLYVGVTAGANLATSDFIDTYEAMSYQGISNKDVSPNVGATVGYNWQVGSAVLGLEGDISWTNFNKRTYGYDLDSTIDAKWNWFSTVRGRIGYATGNVLFYGTAGLAMVGVDHKSQYGSGYMCADNDYSSCVNKTSFGLAIGAGLEVALTRNLSLKGEYLLISLRSQNTTDVNDYTYGWNDSAHVARAGVNYRF